MTSADQRAEARDGVQGGGDRCLGFVRTSHFSPCASNQSPEVHFFPRFYNLFFSSIFIVPELILGYMFCFSRMYLVLTLRLFEMFVASPTHSVSEELFNLSDHVFCFV